MNPFEGKDLKDPYELKPSNEDTNMPENEDRPTPLLSDTDSAYLPPPEPDTDSEESVELEKHDSIFEEEKNSHDDGLAEINFDLLDTGRYLLKVVGGPNNGAEFSMQSGQAYLIGTDPNSCDIVFHDNSVSKQHARLSITEDGDIFVEDLKSRNSTLIDGKAIDSKSPLPANSVVTVGTTSFIVYDREGNMQTIISPFLPEIVKALQKKEEAAKAPVETIESAPPPPVKPVQVKKERPLGTFIVIAMITGLFVIIAMSTAALFKGEPVELVDTTQADAQLKTALDPFKSVTYSFNKNTGWLLIVGHVLTQSDKNQLLYNLQGMPFIKNIDDTGVVIDEYVWQNTNDILQRNPAWRGISIQSPSAGQFVLTGYLQNRKQAEQLYDYITANFPYLDRLQRSLIVEEEITQNVSNILANHDIRSINVQFSNGDLIFTGGVPAGKQDQFLELQGEFKKIPGIRQVRSQVTNMVADTSTINVSDRYEVSGYSKQGNRINIVVNGRIITTGDSLDGMIIKSISPHTILLEKDGINYRIDYSR